MPSHAPSAPPLWTDDRVVYPVAHFTKRQVIDYYRAIAPVILPHLSRHPVTLKRYPDEAGGEFFYEKDAPAFTPPWVKTFPVWRRSRESQIHYIVIDSPRTLEWAASVGTLEIHPFLASIPDVDRPTAVVFDLDPGDKADILDCAATAFLLRNLLSRLQLQSLVKVSGSKGLQLYIPLNTDTSYSVTQPFARTVAELLASENPRRVVAVMEKAQRKGRVFIDWSQNADYKTTVGVYSLRAKRRHPYVSAPVTWDELQHACSTKNRDALFFSPELVLQRVQSLGDLFAPMLSLQQELPPAFTHELLRDGRGRLRTQSAPRRLPKSEPRASAQGSRRRFLLRKAPHQLRGEQLFLEMHDVLRQWDLPDGLPSRTHSASPAHACPDRAAAFTSLARRLSDTDSVGTYELIEGNYRKGYLHLYLNTERLRGEWLLARDNNNRWTISHQPVTSPSTPLPRKSKSRPPQPTRPKPSDTPHLDSRLASLPARAPAYIKPMECKLVASVPDDPSWVYELKLDGYRAIAVKHDARADLLSRYGNSLADRFPAITRALRESSFDNLVLDGEIVALDANGRPSFQELQNSKTTRQPIVYYAFDLLNLHGRDLQNLPLSRRKLLLAELASRFADPLRLAAVIEDSPKSLLKEVRRLGLEGVVAKRRNSRYESGKRSGAWIKFRINEREEFIIGGYIPGPHHLEAILVGRPERNKLHFVKKVRNGFSPITREEVFNAISPLRTDRCPFSNLPEPSDRRGAVDKDEMKRCIWVRPTVKCELDFAEWTEGGRLRHAAFRQLL